MKIKVSKQQGEMTIMRKRRSASQQKTGKYEAKCYEGDDTNVIGRHAKKLHR